MQRIRRRDQDGHRSGDDDAAEERLGCRSRYRSASTVNRCNEHVCRPEESIVGVSRSILPKDIVRLSFHASESDVKRFKLLSWNIDGLDEQANTIDIRTRGVVKVIQRSGLIPLRMTVTKVICREQPDAVFLQEVIPVSLDLLRHSLVDYDVHTGQLNE